MAAQEVLQSSNIHEKYRITLSPPKIAIRFCHQPLQSNLGFTFGKQETCDFPFVRTGISRMHFQITFNKSSGYPIVNAQENALISQINRLTDRGISPTAKLVKNFAEEIISDSVGKN